MIEILPNWHPLFVHFTVALFTIASVFYFLGIFIKRNPYHQQILIVANWCLWLTAVITIGTVIAGFHAFSTVTHDVVSHAAMIAHRNWAIATFIVVLMLALWALLRVRRNQMPNALFLMGMLIGLILVMNTAWHGGELVYRHGLGVVSLPQPSNTEHQHEKQHNHDHQHERGH